MAYAEKRGKSWRVKYRKPNGDWASESGFETKKSALDWGHDQESDIRRSTYIDPKHAKEKFGVLAEKVFSKAKLAVNTKAKYRCYLDKHILPQWEDWPLGAILTDSQELKGWVADLHEELAEPSVASVFAYFSTILEVAVADRKIPANPARGVRVISGEYMAERQVATPSQALRAAMRLGHTFGHAGFVLTLMAHYTGARWSELVVLQPYDYDEVNHAIPVRTPLREVNGKLEVAKKPKTPASERWIQLPPFLDLLYTDLIEASEHPYLFTGPQGGLLRRGNFRQRFWRPAWDGNHASELQWLRPALVPGVTFTDAGRRSHRTGLAEEGIPEVARAARLGHTIPGMKRIYELVTDEMKKSVLTVTETRWRKSVDALTYRERDRLFGMAPILEEHYRRNSESGLPKEPASKMISQISPKAG